MTVPLVDLHCHLLPGVDDGAATPELSAEVLSRFSRDGVRTLCLTPHFNLSDTGTARRAARIERLAAAFAELSARVAQMDDVRIDLHAGAEVMIDEPPRAAHDIGTPLTLGDSHAVLIEFPHSVTEAAVTGTVRTLRQRELVPLVAHPERYACCSPQAVAAWRGAGAWIQLDATTTAFGTHGRGARARELLHHGLADLLAADNHGDDRSLAAAYGALVAAGFKEEAAQLCSVAPGALLFDRPRPVAPSLEYTPETRKTWRIADVVRGFWRRT